MKNTINICMVGTGRMGHAHTKHMAAIPGVVLHTVVGRTREEAEDFSVETGYLNVSTDLETSLLSPEIDAVIIATPNALHALQTETALRAGKHVLCELPLAMNLAKAEELTTVAQQQDKLVMVCHTERYEPGRLELWKRLQTGELHPLQVTADFHLYRPGACQTANDRAPWYDNALWHHGCHAVDAVLSLLGETETLDFHAIHGPARGESGVPLDWALHWQTPTGVIVSLSLSHNALWHKHEYRIICQEETFLCSGWGLLSHRDGVLVERREGPSASQLQDEEFIAAVREDRSPHPPGVDALTALKTIRILQSAWDTWDKNK